MKASINHRRIYATEVWKKNRSTFSFLSLHFSRKSKRNEAKHRTINDYFIYHEYSFIVMRVIHRIEIRRKEREKKFKSFLQFLTFFFFFFCTLSFFSNHKINVNMPIREVCSFLFCFLSHAMQHRKPNSFTKKKKGREKL